MFESTAEKTEKKVNVKDMTVIALVTAVICIIAPFSIPIAISPIPITLALFALFLARHHLRKVERCGVYRDLSAFGYGRTSGVQWF